MLLRPRIRRLVVLAGALLGGACVGLAQAPVARAVSLDEATLGGLIEELPVLRATGGAGRAVAQTPTVPLPLPEGGHAGFVLTETFPMAQALRVSYPELRSFVGFRQNLPQQRVRASYSPSAGWQIAYVGGGGSGGDLTRAVVHAEEGQPAIDRSKATAAGPVRAYRIELASDAIPDSHSCGFAGTPLDDALASAVADRTTLQPNNQTITGQTLRRYRLALTCTGEYARAVGGTNPTKASVLAAMVTAVNRVNEVYERDLGITFELVADNDRLIFLDPDTDPYANNDAEALLAGSQTHITRLIGTDAFDIGHVFATAGSGLATLGSVCDARRKGQGTTGIRDPANDYFYIDFVAHEIGHQLGATHSFYNSCSGNRFPVTAFEPGSGSTIMAYAGICVPNVQPRGDDYFHAASLAQIHATLAGSGGCAQAVATDNQIPLFVEASAPAQVYTIPVGTSFLLEAQAADADGDRLTYTWEQMDNVGTAPQPPASTNADGPLFRSLPPSPSPRRVFTTVSGQFAVLPSVVRDLNFRVTVRDNSRPAGATASRDVRVRAVAGAMPFEVLNLASPTAAVGYASQEVVYRAGLTRRAPINAELVDVFLSADGGQTYSDTLGIGLPNTGRVSVTLPNIDRVGRVLVRGHGNVFYAMSKGSLTIRRSAAPTLLLTTERREFTTCLGEGPFSDTLRGRGVSGFSESVRIGTSALPSGVEVAFDTLPQEPGFAVPLRISLRDEMAPGEYRVGFWAVGVLSGQRFGYAELVLTVPGVPREAPAVFTPQEGSRLVSPAVAFALAQAPFASRARVQVSRSPRFAELTVDSLSAALTVTRELPPGVYYWRVASVNDCGRGPWSATRGFQVLDLVDTLVSSIGGVQISPGAAADYRLSVDVPTARPIFKYEVSTAVTHTWVGDLSASLRLPDGTERRLFGQPAGGDCGQPDLSASFSDEAQASASDFANTCERSAPSIAGRFRAVDSLGVGLPESLSGRWTLTLRDNASDDGGSLDRFDLRYWIRRGPRSTIAVVTDTLFARTGERTPLSAVHLHVGGAGGEVPKVYVMRSAPRFGTLYRGGVPLTATDTFTQASIAAGLIAYESSRATATEAISLDVLVGAGGYFPGQTLTVRVSAAGARLSLAAAVVVEPRCGEAAAGEIALAASGGVAPYMFGIAGGPLGPSGRFTGLAAGEYDFRVVDAVDSVHRMRVALLTFAPFVAEVAGSRIRIHRDGAAPSPQVRYSFDGGLTFATDSVGYVYEAGPVDVIVEAGGCVYPLVATVTRPLRVASTDYVSCPGVVDGTGGEVCISGGVGGSVVSAESATVSSGASTPDCSSAFRVTPAPGVTRVIVTVRDGTDATVTDTLRVVRPQRPEISLIQTNGALTVNSSDGGGAPYAYQLNAGAFQNGNSFVGVGPGPFDISVRDRYGCIYEYLRLSSLPPVQNPLALRVYPNPARDLLTVEVHEALRVRSLTLRTVTGQAVVTQSGEGLGAEIQLDVAHLAAGYYVLELHTDAGIVNAPVVIR